MGRTLHGIRVLELIGRGGMGEVYRGWDDRLQRAVALKRIRSDLEMRRETRTRFLQEARILGRLDHPRICRIHDIVEADGGEVLVLELVEGRTLRQVMLEMDPTRKLAVAEELVEVLVAAHGLGVVHRDLKPDNVMVQADGSIKVLDFGLSLSLDEEAVTEAFNRGVDDTVVLDGAALEDSITATIIRTQVGAVVGTLAYMSPEQARGEESTTASDVYSLGIVLQELFTGQRAYPEELQGADLLVEVAAAKTLPADTGDQDLDRLLERLQSLAPAHRPTVVDVAERLAWIRDRPGRRARRRAKIGAITLLVLVALGTSLLAMIARHQAVRASRAQATAERVTEFLVGIFQESDPGKARGGDPTASELLEAGLHRIDTELREEPAARAQILETLGRVQRNLGHIGEGEELLRRALAMSLEIHGAESAEVAAILQELARIATDLGRYEEAIDLGLQATSLFETLTGKESSEVAMALQPVGNSLRALGRYDEALVALERSLGILDVVAPGSTDLSVALANTGSVHLEQDRPEEAEPYYRQALILDQTLLGDDHYDVATDLHLLSYVVRQQGRLDEAERLSRRALDIRRRVLAPGHHHIAENLGVLSEILLDADRPEEIPALIDEALEIERALSSSGTIDWLLRIRCEAVARLGDWVGTVDTWEELRARIGDDEKGAARLAALRERVLSLDSMPSEAAQHLVIVAPAPSTG